MLVFLGVSVMVITIGLIALAVLDGAHESPQEPWDPWGQEP
jgi:hypothetical protein